MPVRPTVLIADDDAGTRALLERRLRREGYPVEAHGDGPPLIPALRRLRRAIILADWQLPTLGGVALCEEVRRLVDAGEVDCAYIVLLTAHQETERKVTGLEAGADDYLTKPYDPKELLARLRAGERIVDLQGKLLDRQRELTRLNGELEWLANTDTLTGLANRRRIFEHFGEMWSLCRRHQRSLICIMFDIDHFKRVNDTHGHNAGDEVLRGVASIARSVCRAEDHIGRFGGEEFCIIAIETDLHGGVQLAERMRAAIETAVFRHGNVDIKVTASFGVAQRTPHHADLNSLIGDADQMLYRAKDSGRNQVWYWAFEGHEARYEPGKLKPVA